jgi:hypothetical protein
MWVGLQAFHAQAEQQGSHIQVLEGMLEFRGAFQLSGLPN